jgi:hypothetical protein
LLTCNLQFTRQRHPASDDGGRFARRRIQHLGGAHCGHRELHVDSIQQRARDTALIARNRIWGAATGALWMVQIAARAGIHRRHQLKATREIRLPCRARDCHASCLQWLAQYLEYFALKLGQLI